MIPYERREKIIELLRDSDVIKIEELQSHFAIVSLSTLRRDLKELKNEGKIELLSGGGVKLISPIREVSILEKSSLNKKEKEYIARLAGQRVVDGDTIYVDSGSTCFLLLNHLKNKKIHIVTTNTDVLSIKEKVAYEVTLLGGTYNPIISSIFGPLTEENIKQFIFDKSFVGGNGVDPKFGVTTPNLAEASKKKLVVEHSKQAFVLCDSQKFYKVSNVKAMDLKHVSIISDKTDKNLAKLTTLISK